MSVPRGRAARMLALVLAVGALTGCTAGPGVQGPTSAPSSGPSGELRILAAASLATAFDELAARFEARYPDVDVRPPVYDGSSVLATQLEEGAPADVFAAADERTMARVADAGLAVDPVPFASNTLVLAVPRGNPAGIRGLADLSAPGVVVVLCDAEVPCGAASRTLLDDAGIAVEPASEEQNVTAVLTKVAVGEADAGLVYATDVRGRDDVEAIAVPGAARVVNVYPISALAAAPNPEAARAFVAFVLSGEGRDVLDRLGFGAP